MAYIPEEERQPEVYQDGDLEKFFGIYPDMPYPDEEEQPPICMMCWHRHWIMVRCPKMEAN